MADRSAFCSRRCCSKFVPVFYFFGSSYHARARKHVRTHLQCQHFSVRRVCSKLFWHTRLALTVFFLKHDDVGKIQHVLSKASPSVKPQKKYAKKVRCAAVSRLLIGAWPASVVRVYYMYRCVYIYIYIYIFRNASTWVYFFFSFFFLVWGTGKLDQSLCL